MARIMVIWIIAVLLMGCGIRVVSTTDDVFTTPARVSESYQSRRGSSLRIVSESSENIGEDEESVPEPPRVQGRMVTTQAPHMGTCGYGRTILVENNIDQEGNFGLHVGGEDLEFCSGTYVLVWIQNPNGAIVRRRVIPPNCAAKFVFRAHRQIGGYPVSTNGNKRWWIDAYDLSYSTMGSRAFPAGHTALLKMTPIRVPFGARGKFQISDFTYRWAQ